jgi:putative lipoprotein
MRRIVLMLTMLAALGAAGCNSTSSDQSQNSNDNNNQTAKAVSSVSGTVSLVQQRTLSPKATMQIRLVDASVQNAQPLVSKTVAPVDHMPVKFTLDFDPAKINHSDIYVVDVKLTDGVRTFKMPVQAPVLTRGAPNSVDIRLLANQTPKEEMQAAFKKMEQGLGAYQISNGRLLKKDVSYGWQTFRNDDGKVVFVRENIDFGKKGFQNNDFAYKDGKPWVVVVRHKSSQSARASSIDRAGWTDEGELLIHEHTAGGKTSPLSADDAKAMHDKAEEMLQRAREKSPAKNAKKMKKK